MNECQLYKMTYHCLTSRRNSRLLLQFFDFIQRKARIEGADIYWGMMLGSLWEAGIQEDFMRVDKD